jgi:aminoglycoside 2''-phosphotransferase
MSETVKAPPSNPSDLLNQIRQTFPDVTWSSFQYLDVGWDHEVIILDDRLVFRFPNDPEYAKSLKTEVEVLRQLQPMVSSVAIPDYTYVAPDGLFAGYQLITGQPLTSGHFNGLTPDSRDIVASKLAAFLSVMHSAAVEDHAFSAVEASSMLEEQAAVRLSSEENLKAVLSQEDYQRVGAILDATDKILSQQLPSVLLHGDIYNQHLLWDEKQQQLGIIDFSDMNRGDPAFDFAELYEYGEDFVSQTYNYYSGPKDGSFLNRAKVYQKWVGVFMMSDHFVYHKTSFEEARETFDRTKNLEVG